MKLKTSLRHLLPLASLQKRDLQSAEVAPRGYRQWLSFDVYRRLGARNRTYASFRAAQLGEVKLATTRAARPAQPIRVFLWLAGT